MNDTICNLQTKGNDVSTNYRDNFSISVPMTSPYQKEKFHIFLRESIFENSKLKHTKNCTLKSSVNRVSIYENFYLETQQSSNK